ncbi:MAG: DUF3106 domain-containing protein [Acidobacteria bacterium]|nr:DUF3106 domain-containing protein [Acidobacteriota bacterium]
MKWLLTISALAGLLAAPAWAQPRRAPAPGLRAFERLRKMPPAQRQRVLEKLPPERRARLEAELENFNRMPAEQRQKLRKQYEEFRQLPPDQQDAARRLFRRFNTLPENRRPVVREEFLRFRTLTPEERRARINSDEFRNKYTRQEQQLLENLAKTMPAP